MKNHYRRIDVPNYSLAEFVEQAIESRNDSDTSQARAILLDPWKKKIYDRSLFATSRIAQARHQLGLLETPHWTYADYEDFYAKPDQSQAPGMISRAVQFTTSRVFWGRVARTVVVYITFMLIMSMCR